MPGMRCGRVEKRAGGLFLRVGNTRAFLQRGMPITAITELENPLQIFIRDHFDKTADQNGLDTQAADVIRCVMLVGLLEGLDVIRQQGLDWLNILRIYIRYMHARPSPETAFQRIFVQTHLRGQELVNDPPRHARKGLRSRIAQDDHRTGGHILAGKSFQIG